MKKMAGGGRRMKKMGRRWQEDEEDGQEVAEG